MSDLEAGAAVPRDPVAFFIARLMAQRRPSRQLDAEIGLACGVLDYKPMIGMPEGTTFTEARDPRRTLVLSHDWAFTHVGFAPGVLPYSGCFEAAVGLMPEGWALHVSGGGGARWNAYASPPRKGTIATSEERVLRLPPVGFWLVGCAVAAIALSARIEVARKEKATRGIIKP